MDSMSGRATDTVSPIDTNRWFVPVSVSATKSTSESALLRTTTPSTSRTSLPRTSRIDAVPAAVSERRTVPLIGSGVAPATGTSAVHPTSDHAVSVRTEIAVKRPATSFRGRSLCCRICGAWITDTPPDDPVQAVVPAGSAAVRCTKWGRSTA